MSYEIQVSTTNPVVTSSSTEYSVTVQSPATANFTITNSLSTVTINKIDSTTTVYTDAVELVLANLNDFWRGTWSASSTYIRGDIVDYQYSQYFLSNFDIDPLTVYGPSATPPSEDSNWIRFNWHEAPFAVLTVTNTATFNSDVNIAGDLTLGGGAGGNGLTINSTATFNGRLFVNDAATFNSTATFNGDVNLTAADLQIEDLILNGDKWIEPLRIGVGDGVRTAIIRTTSTNKNIRIGISSSTQFGGGVDSFFYDSPAFTDYQQQGLIAHLVPTVLYPTIPTFKNQFRLEQSYGAIQAITRNYEGSPAGLVNLVEVNTNTARITAYTGGNGATQFLNGDGFVPAIYGGFSQTVAASNTGTNTLTNYIHLTRDGIESHSYAYYPEGLDTNWWVRSRNIQTNKRFLTQVWPKLNQPFPWNNPGISPLASVSVENFRYNLSDLGLIYSTATNFAINANEVTIAPNPTVIGNNLYFSIGSTIQSRGSMNSDDSVFRVFVGGGDSTLHVDTQRAFIAPKEYLWIDTPSIVLKNTTVLQISASGVQYNDSSIQTIAWEGYDQGTTASVKPALQLKRATLSEIQSYTPEEGELVYSTNTNKLYVGDGATAGGILVSGGEGQDFDFGTILTPAIFSLDLGTF